MSLRYFFRYAQKLLAVELKMNEELVNKTQEFVKESFLKRPHYSFNDWSIMYNHSVLVKDIALKISKGISCDKLIVSVGALLHDIGKTHKADPETLHKEHESFNLKISEKFLESLALDKEQFKKLKEVVSCNSDSIESKIIKHADALAFYADKTLHTAYIKWAKENNLNNAIQRKLEKFSKLNFEQSKIIVEKWFEETKKDWGI